MTTEIKCLDKGFVRLENFSGDGDDAVVRAARISYGAKEPDEEKDKKLISYMLNHEHGTPFEHNLFTIHVKAPILVFRQWHRTRIGISYNEVSARYSEMVDEFYLPTVFRAQESGPKANKQGSVAANLDHNYCQEIMERNSASSFRDYKELLDRGVAREMARMVLPVNLYSAMYFTCNARSLMNFIALRSDSHAQAETRVYSHGMAVFLKEQMPWTWEAFESFLKKKETQKKKDYTELWEFLENYK